MVLQIQPKLTYEASKDYRKLVKELEQLRARIVEEQVSVSPQGTVASPKKTI
jgi:hypothetical protein